MLPSYELLSNYDRAFKGRVATSSSRHADILELVRLVVLYSWDESLLTHELKSIGRE